MYIPVWILFTMVVWTWLGADLCSKEAYAAGLERRSPDYRSCWGLASIVIGMFVATFVAIFLVTPIAVTLVAGIFNVALRPFS